MLLYWSGKGNTHLSYELFKNNSTKILEHTSVADPGFPVGGGRGPRTGAMDPRGGLRFKSFACQNERIWTRRGGARRARPPLDPPMYMYWF